MRNFLILWLLMILSAYSKVTGYSDSGSGIDLTVDISGEISIDNIKISGKEYTKFIYPDKYLPIGKFPKTERYSRTFYFTAPVNSSPQIDIMPISKQTYSVSELVPFKNFIKGKDGIFSEIYEIPEKRNDNTDKHIIIHYAGMINGINTYKIIFTPLQIKGGKAELLTSARLSIDLGKEFSRSKNTSYIPENEFEKSILNYGYIKKLKNSKEKITDTFLDRRTEWAKIRIPDQGIYRITGMMLENKGFNISSVLCDKIKMYSSKGPDINIDPTSEIYHGAQEISRRIIDKNSDDYFNSDDEIIFYAAGTTSLIPETDSHYYNRYSEHSYYWIDTGINSQQDGIEMIDISTDTDEYTDIGIFKKHIFAEDRNSYMMEGYNFRWYNDILPPLNSVELSFEMTDIDNNFPVQVKVNNSDDIINNYRKTEYSINNDPSSTDISYEIFYENEFSPDLFNENSINTLKLTNLESTNPKYYNGYDIIYYGTMGEGDKGLNFTVDFSASDSYRLLLDVNDGSYIYDITEPYQPEYAQINNGGIILRRDAGLRDMYLFDGSYRTPDNISKYDNSAIASLHSKDDQVDMIIISASEFYEQLKDNGLGLISAHLEADDDINSVEVVNIDRISNEFGRGYQEPAATRNFIKYSYENRSTEYFLLIGDGNYFIKNEPNAPQKNFIYTSDRVINLQTETGSDDFYANLYTTSPSQNVSIGRFPVSSLNELKNVIDKTVNHIKNEEPGLRRSKVLLVADDERNPDYNRWYETVHINNTESLIYPEIPGYYYCDKLYSTEYPFEFSSSTGLLVKPSAQEDLIRKLQNGINVFCYVGHGAPQQLAHEKLFTPNVFSRINNYNKYFFMIGATCSFGVFNDPYTRNLAEEMLIAPQKGSIGLINSVAPVYSGPNERLVAKIFSEAIEDPANKLSIGKALKQAKLLNPSTNSASFMLLGDPALKFFSDKSVISSDNSIELYTLQKDSVTSRIQDGGNTQGTMNTVIIEPERRTAYYNDERWDDKDSLIYSLPGNIILSAFSSINNSVSDAVVILPKDLTYGENSGSVIFYGYDQDGNEYSGNIPDVSIRGNLGTDIIDSIPPQIKIFYNSLNYISGDPIGNDPVVFIEVSDANGINTSGGIGHKLKMEVDGKETDITNSFNYSVDDYTKGYASYQLLGLSQGEHNIKVSAWDNFNNYNEKTEVFSVIDESSKNSSWISNLMNYPNPIENNGTDFGFSVNSQNDLSSYTITVYTINGRKIKILRNSSVNFSDPFQHLHWNGLDDDGDKPANGVYLYVLRAEFSDGNTVNKRGKLLFAR